MDEFEGIEPQFLKQAEEEYNQLYGQQEEEIDPIFLQQAEREYEQLYGQQSSGVGDFLYEGLAQVPDSLSGSLGGSLWLADAVSERPLFRESDYDSFKLGTASPLFGGLTPAINYGAALAGRGIAKGVDYVSDLFAPDDVGQQMYKDAAQRTAERRDRLGIGQERWTPKSMLFDAYSSGVEFAPVAALSALTGGAPAFVYTATRSFGDISGDLLNDGIDPDKVMKAASIAAPVMGGIEMLGNPGTKTAGGIFTRGLTSGLKEAAEEGLQTPWTALVKQEVAGQEQDWASVAEDTLYGMSVAAGPGFAQDVAFQSIGDYAARKAQARESAATDEVEADLRSEFDSAIQQQQAQSASAPSVNEAVQSATQEMQQEAPIQEPPVAALPEVAQEQMYEPSDTPAYDPSILTEDPNFTPEGELDPNGEIVYGEPTPGATELSVNLQEEALPPPVVQEPTPQLESPVQAQQEQQLPKQNMSSEAGAIRSPFTAIADRIRQDGKDLAESFFGPDLDGAVNVDATRSKVEKQYADSPADNIIHKGLKGYRDAAVYATTLARKSPAYKHSVKAGRKYFENIGENHANGLQAVVPLFALPRASQDKIGRLMKAQRRLNAKGVKVTDATVDALMDKQGFTKEEKDGLVSTRNYLKNEAPRLYEEGAKIDIERKLKEAYKSDPEGFQEARAKEFDRIEQQAFEMSEQWYVPFTRHGEFFVYSPDYVGKDGEKGWYSLHESAADQKRKVKELLKAGLKPEYGTVPNKVKSKSGGDFIPIDVRMRLEELGDPVAGQKQTQDASLQEIKELRKKAAALKREANKAGRDRNLSPQEKAKQIEQFKKQAKETLSLVKQKMKERAAARRKMTPEERKREPNKYSGKVFTSDGFIRQRSPEGFSRHLMKANLMAGEEVDITRSLSSYIHKLGIWNAQMKGRAGYDAAYDLIPENDTFLRNRNREDADYILNPHEEFKAFRQLMAAWYLSRASTAITNMTQHLTTTVAELSGKNYYNSIFKAHKAWGKAVWKATNYLIAKHYSPKKLANFTKQNPELAAALDRALSAGVINDQATKEMQARATASALEGNKLDMITDWMLLGMKGSEYHLRTTAFIAGWEFANKKNLDFDTKFEAAEQFVFDTQFDQTKVNRPKMFRGKGAPFGLFRNFMGNFIRFQRNAYEDKDWRKMITSLGWGFSLGGLATIPFLKDILNTMKAMGGPDVNKKIRETSAEYLGPEKGEFVADVINKGVPYATNTYNFSSSLQAGELVPVFEYGAEAGLLRGILGVVMDPLQRGKAAQDLATRRGNPGSKDSPIGIPLAVEEGLPPILRSAHRGARWANADSYLNKDMTRMAHNPTPWEIAHQILGTQPPRLDKLNELRFGAFKINEEETDTGDINAHITRAILEKDPQAKNELMKWAKENNKTIHWPTVRKNIKEINSGLRNISKKSRPKINEYSELFPSLGDSPFRR